MAEQPLPPSEPPADPPLPTDQPRTVSELDFLPFEDGADAGDAISRRVGPVDPARFLYLGQALTADEFAAYVQSYDFGTIPPDFVVLHHTANPCTIAAPYPGGAAWDADEGGLSADQIKDRRLKKLAAIKEYYRTTTSLLWDRGPHLFVDDHLIYLFTPMREIGIHAAWGNSYNDAQGLHYSIGIEVIGYYEHVPWPEPVARLVGHAVAVLKRRLGTFEIRYQRNAGGISAHRDYNKPQCPGAAITSDYYIGVLNAGWQRLTQPAPTITASAQSGPLTADAPILGAASGVLAEVAAYVKARLPQNSEYANDVDKIFGYYYQYAPGVGVDPFLAAAQCVHETDGLKSYRAGRPRRNPAGLGVKSRDEGLSFASWEDAVQAHLGQLLAFAVRDDQATEAQGAMMQRNPRHGAIGSDQRGSAPTLRGLNNRWAADPTYADKIVARANAMKNAA